ncbi:MAG: DUF192 domain-containing protein [Chloroflexota bacterium]
MPHKIEIFVNNQSLNNPIQVIYCDTFFCRLRGFMFRHNIALDEGLILVQNRESKIDSSIHMLSVFMNLAVVWIDSSFSVVDVILAKSWHLVYLPAHPAMYTLEIHPDRISEFKVGDKVSFYEV